MHTLKNFYQRVANRGNFCNPPMTDLESFRSYPQSAEAAELRGLLKLDVGVTDYYARGLVAALTANYDIMIATGERVRVTDIAIALTLMPLNTGIRSMDAGVKIVAASNNPTGLIRSSARWPVSHEILLRKIDSTSAYYDTANVAMAVQAYLSGDTLRVSWPADTGLDAAVLLTNPGSQWADGAQLRFFDEPEHYDYQGMLAAIEPTAAWLRLLNRFGMAAHYAGAVGQHVTRAGLLAAALILDTKTA